MGESRFFLRWSLQLQYPGIEGGTQYRTEVQTPSSSCNLCDWVVVESVKKDTMLLVQQQMNQRKNRIYIPVEIYIYLTHTPVYRHHTPVYR